NALKAAHDIGIHLAMSPASPGNLEIGELDIQNNGDSLATTTVALRLDSILNPIYFSINPDSFSNNLYTWHLDSLKTLITKKIRFYSQCSSTVNYGYPYIVWANAYLANDSNPSDNADTLKENVQFTDYNPNHEEMLSTLNSDSLVND